MDNYPDLLVKRVNYSAKKKGTNKYLDPTDENTL